MLQRTLILNHLDAEFLWRHPLYVNILSYVNIRPCIICPAPACTVKKLMVVHYSADYSQHALVIIKS